MSTELVEKEIDLSKIKLAIGIPIFGNPYYPFMESLFRTKELLSSLGIAFELMMDVNNPYIALARNRISKQFMASDCDRILWLDHDMGWNDQDIINLLFWSTKYDFVAGVYPIKTEPLTYKLKMSTPLIKDSQGLIKAEAVPIGFTIVNKRVFNSMEKNALPFSHEDTDLKEYFFEGLIKEKKAYKFIGEDIFFCGNWKKGIWIDPEVNPIHYGIKGYHGNFAEIATKKFGVKKNGL